MWLLATFSVFIGDFSLCLLATFPVFIRSVSCIYR